MGLLSLFSVETNALQVLFFRGQWRRGAGCWKSIGSTVKNKTMNASAEKFLLLTSPKQAFFKAISPLLPLVPRGETIEGLYVPEEDGAWAIRRIRFLHLQFATKRVKLFKFPDAGPMMRPPNIAGNVSSEPRSRSARTQREEFLQRAGRSVSQSLSATPGSACTSLHPGLLSCHHSVVRRSGFGVGAMTFEI